MANTLLTPTAVVMETLRIAHQRANFIGNVTRDYDDKYAKSGGKIGTTLTIRLPNEYTVRTGKVIAVQNTTEPSVVMTLATQKGVDMVFDSSELTMSIDRFSERYIQPAISKLIANVEADAMSMYKDIYNSSNQSTITSALTQATVLAGKKKLNDFLAPLDGRIGHMTTQNTVDLVSDAKSLFHDSVAIKEQYREGSLGRFSGFEFYENSLWARHTSGTETTTMDVNGADQVGASITVTNGSSKTLTTGDIVTFAGTNAVHPESKADLGYLKQFVVTSAVATSGTSIPISPAMVLTGATQNISASPTTTGTVTKVGGASGAMDVSLLYHPEAFAFVTADLEMPGGVDFASRKVLDGISMRVIRQYDINNDLFPCRIDILYGYKTIRPQFACRLASNSSA